MRAINTVVLLLAPAVAQGNSSSAAWLAVGFGAGPGITGRFAAFAQHSAFLAGFRGTGSQEVEGGRTRPGAVRKR